MFTWNNVYNYDRQFRIFISEHPKRNWGIILQKAWTFFLNEKLSQGVNLGQGSNLARLPKTDSKRKGKICYRYNRGNCTYGLNCKFDHRCGFCDKFGHGGVNCRKAGFNQEARKQNIRDNREKGVERNFEKKERN